MEYFIDFGDWIKDFFTGNGTEPGLFDHALAWATIFWFKIKIAALQQAWDVAEAILVQLDISGPLNSAWASIDGELMGYMTFFKIPDAFNIILQARVTRFVLDMWGW